MTDPKYITEARAAELLDLAPATLRNWRSRSTGPTWRKLPGGAIRYRLDELIAWVDSGTVDPALHAPEH